VRQQTINAVINEKRNYCPHLTCYLYYYIL